MINRDLNNERMKCPLSLLSGGRNSKRRTSSSIKKCKLPKRGWEARAEQGKENRQKKKKADHVTSQEQIYEDEESEECVTEDKEIP